VYVRTNDDPATATTDCEPAVVTLAQRPGVVATADEVDTSPESTVVAFAAAADKRPKPIEATATTAMRLRSVFVDMFFLSLVRFRNFLDLARRSCEIF
jgi:hypothetical protein